MISHNEVLKKHGLTTRKLTDNITKIYKSATPEQISAGFGWYPAAERHAEILAESAPSKANAAAVISHLSPRLSWGKNISAAYDVIEGRQVKGIMSRSLKKAQESLTHNNPLETFNGPKTRAFYLNIIGVEDEVTVDVHAIRAATGMNLDINNKALYDAIARSYRLVSDRLGIAPRDCQAVVWTVQRGRA